MLGLVLRKSLVDIWDGLVLLFAGNLVVLGLATFLVHGLEIAARAGPAALGLAAPAAAAILAMALAAYAMLVAQWVRHRQVDLATLARAARPVILPAGLLALPLAGLAIGAAAAIGHLAGLGTVAAAAAAAILAALAAGGGLFALFLLPAVDAAPDIPLWRRAALMVFDNLGYALLVALLAGALAILTAGLLPGVGGGLVLLRNATILRLRRYPGPRRPDWPALLEPEIRQMQRRPWKSLLLPWRS